jgi:hypothetical protein
MAAIAVVVAMVGGLVALSWRDANNREMDRQVTFAFKSTLLALDSARIMTKALPAPNKLDDTGKPLSSWRFRITPYLEFEPRFHADLNADWQSPANYRARGRKPASYCFLAEEQPDSTTNVFAVVGPCAALDGDRTPTEEKLPASLIVLMETADGATHWMQPGDYDVTTLLAAEVLGDVAKGARADRVHVAFADAEVWALQSDTPMDRLKPFLTVDAAKSASRGDLREFRLPMNPTQRR